MIRTSFKLCLRLWNRIFTLTLRRFAAISSALPTLIQPMQLSQTSFMHD